MSRRRRFRAPDGVAKILLLLGALTLLKGLLGFFLPFLPLTQDGRLWLSMAEEVLLCAVPAILWKTKPSARLGRMNSKWPCVLAAAVMGLALRGVIAPLTERWVQWLQIEETTLIAATTPAQVLLQVMALAVVPAVVEEWLFRGVVLNQLLDGAGRWTAFVLTTLLFALMHGAWAGLPAHLLIGAALTLTMMRTGKLMASMAMHLTYNLSALVWPGMAMGWRAVCVAALLGLAAWACATMPRVTHQRMKRTNICLAAGILLLMTVPYWLAML